MTVEFLESRFELMMQYLQLFCIQSLTLWILNFVVNTEEIIDTQIYTASQYDKNAYIDVSRTPNRPAYAIFSFMPGRWSVSRSMAGDR